MQLRLSHLRNEAAQAVERSRAATALRAELRHALGSSVPERGPLFQLVEAAHDSLDRLDPGIDLGMRTSVIMRFVDDDSREVRRLAARLLPGRFTERLSNDADPSVRRAAITRRHALREAVLDAAAPTTRLTGDVIKQHEGPELSDSYYRSLAERLMQDFGRRMEYGWEAAAARRLASSTRATTGVELDEERLLEALDELRDEREEAALDRADMPLREAAAFFKRRAVAETPVMPIVEESRDPVAALDERSPDFLDEAAHVFALREADIPAALRKHRLREGVATPLRVPISGRLPHGRPPRALDERILDAYTRRWNERAAMTGEPVRITWSPAVHRIDGITFSAELR